MTDLTITHTPEDGTLIDGTAKGDGSGEVLKAHGWRWGRSIGAWFVPVSRDRMPKRYVITPTVRALEEAGFSVAVELEERYRSTAEVEADKIARQDERVQAMEGKAERFQARAEQAHARAESDHDRLPPGGEPVKVGHHSERRHRRALERSWKSAGRSVEAQEQADAAARRATVAASTTGARYSVLTVANRIKRIQADIARVDRALEGGMQWRGSADDGYCQEHVQPEGERRERLMAEMQHLADELCYWQEVREQQVKDGKATNYGPGDIAKGDAVRISGQWRRVVRVNAKTVSVETGYSWTDRAPYAAITEHVSATP